MKLKEGFITHEAGGRAMLVPTGSAGFAGLVRGNRTFGAILELLQEETTEEEIILAMCARFDAPPEKITADVKKALQELQKIGALEA